MSTEPHASPALEAAARRRRELRAALISLEEAISSPVRTPESWRLFVAERLGALQHAFADHVAETERPGGLYDELEDMDMHVVSTARRLREEHPQLGVVIEAEMTRFSVPFPDGTDLGAIRDDVQRLMGRIVRHRQAGSDLVWQAYAVDIGTAG
jgi:hypothetical protein